MTGEENTAKPFVFISYSHQDEDWKDRLKIQLKVLEQLGRLEVWDDRKIDPGGAWYEAIGEVMANAKAAICLISAPYLASDFCVKEEIPYLLEQMEEQGLILVPVLIRPCPWSEVPWLKRLQMIPRDGVTVASLEANEQDQVFSDLASKLNTMLRMAAEERQLAVSLDSEIGPKAGLVIGYPALADQFIDIERLPVTGAELFGRQAELKMLDEAWDSETNKIVSLVAWGGVGKSTLLNKWVEYLEADNYRGARRVFAWSFYSQGTSERVTSADEFVSEALKFFGDDDPSAGSPWAKGERLAELVGREKALLLLDGMEPLQDQYQGIKDPALARLIECLAVRNEGLCVITTREPVKELSDFTETSLQKNLEFLSPEAGRALLRVKGVRGSDAELEAASAAFGNHALAINLLASFLRDCEGKHIRHAAEIPDLADLDDPNHRHPRRVMAAFAGLFGEGPELDLLHMMGLFDRPADAGCIAALRREPAVPGLTNELSKLDEAGWLRLLEQLRDLGLLAEASHHDPNELDAHPLVREHFGAELQNLQPGVWMAGHGRLYEHLKDLPEKHQPDTLAEMASLFQAIRHGCEAKRQQEVHDEVYSARINRGKKLYLVKKLGAFGADLGVMASFFDIVWEKPTSSLRETTQSSLLIGTAFNLAALGQLRSAMGLMLAGLKRLIKEENWKGAAINTYNLNELRLAMGDIADAVTLAKVGIEYADRTGEERERMISRANLANALLHSGNLQAAKTLFEEAETIQAKYQPSCPKLFAVWGYYYCDLLFYFERIETIQERAHYSLSLEATHTDLLSVALDNLSLGRAAFGQGQHADALVQFNQAVEGLRQSGQFQKLPRGLLARAALFCDAQKYDEARRDIDEAMRIATRCGMRLFECDAHLEYARLDLAEGNPDAARVHLKSTKALVSACGYHRRDGEIAEVEAALA